jgi:hypothetical protein
MKKKNHEWSFPQHTTRIGGSIVSAARGILDLRRDVPRVIANIADELTRRTSPARELTALADAPAVRVGRLASRRRGR